MTHVCAHDPSMTSIDSYSPFKYLSNPEIGHICHSGQIQNSLLCHPMVTILVHFGHFCAPHV